ncbi:class F sortase [Streptomyces sp. MS191]|uniref:class F sortase n=1 Tax=Streptomyces sp. ms191 TaxID=1827978 RepID=UPI0016503A02|nr:class F sortase [Streptomyces sp. ms191]
MPRTGHRKILGTATALVGVILAVATVLLATAWADDPSSARDFGSPQPAMTPSVTGQPQAPAATPARPSSRATPSGVPLPRELSIPRLELRAPIDPVGVAGDGQMQVPEDPDRVGWYRFSPRPGAGSGSSVIVGHIDARERGLGVLLGLTDVRTGDRVLVEKEDSTIATYEIIARRTVPKNALAGSGVFTREGPAVLTLITCAGPYLPDHGGYQNNLVVTAVEVPK